MTDGDVWKTAKEWVDENLPGLPQTRQGVRYVSTRNNWPSRQRVGRGGGREYPLSALPPTAQLEWARRHAAQAGPLVYQAGSLVCKKTTDRDVPANVVVPDWAFAVAHARARIVMEWRKYCAAQMKAGKLKGEASKEYMLLLEAGEIVPAKVLEDARARSLKSIYCWDKLLREANGNFDVLADRRGKWLDGGPKGLGQLGPEAEGLLLKIWLTPNRPTMKLAWRAACAVLAKKEQPLPCYSSAIRFFRRFDANHHDLVVLRREGEKALRDQVGPYIARNASILAVGDILFADGHVLNFDSLHPTTGKPCRLTLIVWFDWRSRMPVGWEIMPEETTLSIASALHMAIRNLGKTPKVVYIDNGKAFRAKYFENVTDFDGLDGLYVRLGIDVQHSKPYAAQTKIVERFWGTFNEQCARLLPSYRGNSVDDKPAYLMRAEKYHKARHNDYVPTVHETAQIFASYVDWYANNPHGGLDGASPWSVFEPERGPGVDLQEMDRHFLLRKKIDPKRTGFVIAGVRFESDALYGLNKPVMAAYSWADLSEVALYDMENGARIGVARPVETLNPLAKHFGDALDMQAVIDANKRQQTLRKSTLALAGELGGSNEALNALPWMRPANERRAPLVLVKSQTPPALEAPPALSAEETAELEALSARLQAEKAAAPPYETPTHFASPRERYEYLFELLHVDGVALTDQDAAFMQEFEASPAYESSAKRFGELKALFGRNQTPPTAAAL